MKEEFVNQQPNQTLAKALLILETMGAQKGEWGVRELGRELGINPATVHRLVTTFQNAGYLKQNPQTQRYSLGPKLMKLASQYMHQNPFPSQARQIFESYSDRFEYNFYLGMLSLYEVIYLAVLDGRGPIKIVVDPGGTTALHTTALGKVLLSFQDDVFIREFLNTTDLTAYTKRSITDPKALWEEISITREQKYAVNDGEHFEDVGAVGVPVYDRSGKVLLGVSLAYPRHLIYEGRITVEELVPLAREIADEISQQLEPPFRGI